MTNRKSPSSGNEPRVVSFRPGRTGTRMPLSAPSPVDDLAKYEHGDDDDNYRHRMIVNVLAFLFVIVLMAAGLWLADTMARMRKNQDCVLSGRSGCTPVDFKGNRW